MFDILLTIYEFIEGVGYEIYTVARMIYDSINLIRDCINTFQTIKSSIDFPEPFSSLITLIIGMGILKFFRKG